MYPNLTPYTSWALYECCSSSHASRQITVVKMSHYGKVNDGLVRRWLARLGGGFVIWGLLARRRLREDSRMLENAITHFDLGCVATTMDKHIERLLELFCRSISSCSSTHFTIILERQTNTKSPTKSTF